MAATKRITDHLAPADWITLGVIATQAAVLLWRVSALEKRIEVMDERLWQHMRPAAAVQSACPADAADWPRLSFAGGLPAAR